MSDYLPGKLLMVDNNGNEIEVQGTIDLNESEEFCNYALSVGDYIPNPNISFDINTSTILSRKKFIKLLMSKGIGRNGANEIAKHVLKKNGRYTMIDILMW